MGIEPTRYQHERLLWSVATTVIGRTWQFYTFFYTSGRLMTA